MPTQDKHFIQAHKNVVRTRHQFIMHLAKMGMKHMEITPIINSIDWSQEAEWAAEELRAKEPNTPAPPSIEIPPPQVASTEN